MAEEVDAGVGHDTEVEIPELPKPEGMATGDLIVFIAKLTVAVNALATKVELLTGEVRPAKRRRRFTEFAVAGLSVVVVVMLLVVLGNRKLANDVCDNLNDQLGRSRQQALIFRNAAMKTAKTPKEAEAINKFFEEYTAPVVEQPCDVSYAPW